MHPNGICSPVGSLARTALITAVLAGCTPLYDSQFDDRAGELEEHRVEFLPAADRVKLIASGQDRMFWVSVERPADENLLHSVLPRMPSSRVDYEWSRDHNEIAEYHFGTQMVAECTFGTSRAFKVDEPNTPIGDGTGTSMGFDKCAVDGMTVYFLIGSRVIKSWSPATNADPVELVNLETAGIAGQVDAFGVIGNLAVAFESDGDIYTVDLTTKQATWLENAEPARGTSTFDATGVFFDTGDKGVRYISFADHVEKSLDALIADGGYHLSWKLDDVQNVAGNVELALQGRHLIYRANRGIFAYGLDSGNVVDLLLDRGEGIDTVLAYHKPAVTTDGTLFVTGEKEFSSSDAPVFSVDLTDRLK